MIVRNQASSTPWPTVASENQSFVADGWEIAQDVATRHQEAMRYQTLPKTDVISVSNC